MVPAWMEVQNSSIIVSKMCSSLDGCEYCALLTSRLDVSAEAFPQMVVGVSYHAGGCECCAFPKMVAGVSYHAGGYKC